MIERLLIWNMHHHGIAAFSANAMRFDDLAATFDKTSKERMIGSSHEHSNQSSEERGNFGFINERCVAFNNPLLLHSSNAVADGLTA